MEQRKGKHHSSIKTKDTKQNNIHNTERKEMKMYKRTFKFNTKPAFKKVHKLIEDVMICDRTIIIDTCKKANRITVTADSRYDLFKVWRSIGMTPIEYYKYSV